MAKPSITMITAALNPGPEVRETIESVLSQAYSSVEYIFVDGNSRAEAFAYVEPYRKYFSTLIREPDEGISDAWNKAIACATGDIIGIVSADDYLLPGALAAVADAYARDGGSPIVHGRGVRIEKDHKTLRDSRVPLQLMIWFGTPVIHPATFVPRVIYNRIGCFNKSYRIAMDYDFILRAYRAGTQFVRIEHPLVGFRSGGLSERSPLQGFHEVRDSQLANGLNTPLVKAIHVAKLCVRRYVRPMLGID